MNHEDFGELLEVNQRLLDAIAAGDWATYEQLCDVTLTAFEPEARGHLVEGLDFHRYYFAGDRPPCRVQNTMAAPHLRQLGDVAVLSYIRLVQHPDAQGHAQTARFEETRVWVRSEGRWIHVHFHRSTNA